MSEEVTQEIKKDEPAKHELSVGRIILYEWAALVGRTFAYVSGKVNFFSITLAAIVLLTYLLAIGHTGTITWIVFLIIVVERLLNQWAYSMAITGIRSIQSRLRQMGVL